MKLKWEWRSEHRAWYGVGVQGEKHASIWTNHAGHYLWCPAGRPGTSHRYTTLEDAVSAAEEALG